jgi:hypothetical protein
MDIQDWANSNDGFIDLAGNIAALQQRRNLFQAQLATLTQVTTIADAIAQQQQQDKLSKLYQDILFDLHNDLSEIAKYSEDNPARAILSIFDIRAFLSKTPLAHTCFQNLSWKQFYNDTIKSLDELDLWLQDKHSGIYRFLLVKTAKKILPRGFGIPSEILLALFGDNACEKCGWWFRYDELNDRTFECPACGAINKRKDDSVLNVLLEPFSKWYVALYNKRITGPYTLHDIAKNIETGKISMYSLFWTNDVEDWFPLSRLLESLNLVYSISLPPPLPEVNNVAII